MNLELRQLRHAVVLARLLNYRKAADELGITQSSLSRSIQATEDLLQTRLFDRDRSGVRVTAAGKEFVDRAERVIHASDELSDAMGRVVQGREGIVPFGMGPLIAKMILPDLLGKQLADAPDLRSTVIVGGFAELLPLLLAERIEFFIASPPRAVAIPPAVDAATIAELPISLLVRKGHPLLHDGALKQEPARQYPLYASSIREMPIHLLSKVSAFVGQRPAVLSDDSGLLSRLTGTTDGIWLSSALVAQEEIATGSLALLPIELPQPNTFMVARFSLRARSHSPASRQLIARARSLLRRRNQNHTI
jgi:DNA-binding transcriptional LysR family regulator